jgi:TRAP transporter TAXI family solute receptor
MKGLAALCAFALAASVASADAATRRLTIATGGVTGVYYSAGKAICAAMNKDTKKTNISCTAATTRGSADNAEMLRSGRAEIAIIQADAQWHAYRGTGSFADKGPDRSLRTVLRLHPEIFTVLVRKDSDIAAFAELRDSLFGLGSEASDARVTVRALAGALGWPADRPRVAPGLRGRDLGRALCDRLADAVAFVTGHPSHAVQEPVSTCGARIVPVVGPAVDRLVAERPYFEPAGIPRRAYVGVDGEIPSFASRAVVVAASHVPANLVHAVIDAVMRNVAAIRRAHPALSGLRADEMRPTDKASPVHEGAERWFREQKK